MTAPVIHVRKDGPFYRVLVLPPEAMPGSFGRPATYVAHSAASEAARLLSVTTGWSVTDLSEARS